MNITINIVAPELAKAIDNLSIAVVSAMSKVPSSGQTAKALAKAEVAAAKTPAKEAKVEVVKPTHNEAAVTAKAKELVAAASPAVLRAVLDDIIGAGVKISGAPESSYDAIFAAVDAKLAEINDV